MSNGHWQSRKEFLAWMVRRRKRFVVEGNSMVPFCHAGQQVLVNPYSAIAIGDVIVLRHPFRSSQILIKRVQAIDRDGATFAFTVSGDNPQESTDSRSFGTILAQDVIGKVTTVI